MGLRNPINQQPTPGKLISANTTNSTLVSANPSSVKYLMASNTNASPRYLKVYNTKGAPVVGTDVPVHTFLIPGNSGSGTNLPLPKEGIGLDKGFGFALTTGAADNDTGAVGANEIIVNYGNATDGIDSM